jgi:hypothetical protein
MRFGKILRFFSSRVGVQGEGGCCAAAAVAAAAATGRRCLLGAAAAAPAAGAAAWAAHDCCVNPRKLSKLVRARVGGSSAAAGAARLHVEGLAAASRLRALHRACRRAWDMPGCEMGLLSCWLAAR